jgi:putative peptide zinc metalloprotease protein
MTLPPLREELRLHPAGTDWDGSPCWVIHDQAAHRFHRIGWLEFEFLARWHLGNPDAILSDMGLETTLRPTPADLQGFIAFLEQNQLVRVTTPDGTGSLAGRARRGRLSPERWLLHNYLFFRIPLFKADRLLDRLLPLAAPLLTGRAAVVFLVIGLFGLYLAARQWDHFTAGFASTLSPAGLFGYALAMSLAKCGHELGHALLAKKEGIRVPRMGVAFMVMFPVLYTDLGEGWLLRDHRLRRLVSAGGLLAEGALAAVALFCWGILEDGATRDACYFVAVVSIGRSLLVNISPFMRFDGYYLLSDHLNLPNLQERAFAMTRHLLRRWLLGLTDEPPETVSPRMTRLFVVYSVATWIYRLVVFLGIALAVYYYFFKLLGIVLMAVELYYFIALPVIRELVVWRKRVPDIASFRLLRGAVAVAVVLLVAAVPWRRTINLPALVTAEKKQLIYAPFAARVAVVPTGEREYRAGETIFAMDAEDLRFQSRIATIQAAELRQRLRLLPTEAKGLEQAAVWREQLAEREQALHAQSAELGRLILKAEFDGRLVDLDAGVKSGSHVTSRDLLATLVDGRSVVIDAFADQHGAARIRPGARAVYYGSDRTGQVLRGEVLAVEKSRLTTLPLAALADRHGGTIATVADAQGRLTPRESLYRVRIRLAQAAETYRTGTGTVAIQSLPESLLGRLLRQSFSVLLRESGF